ncbi:MAG: hypothetical protein J5I93_12650, partial [Pirellulaceae bacterium]|nr:hypothetical protein [Pirellulaceae bacterium]
MQHTVQQKVRAVGQRARWLVRWEGLSRWAIVVVLVVLAACLLDWGLRFREHGVRWIVSTAVLGATMWSAWRWLLPAARFGPSDLEVAQWMERGAPEFQNRLSSAIAFLDQPADDPLAGSAELRRAVVAEAEVQVAGYDAARCLDRSGPRRAVLGWLAVSLLAGGLLATDFAWFWLRQRSFQSWPSSVLALARLAAPWSPLEWPRWNMLQFKRGPELLALGGDFEAEVVDQRGHLPDVVEIEYWFEGDPPDQVQRKLMKPMPDGAMLHRLDNVTRPFRYRAVGGDHRHMAWTSLRLVEPPRVAAHQLVLHPPEYTGLPSGDSGPRIEALVGTRIAVRGTTTRPVRQVRLRVDQDPRAGRVPVRLGEDGRSFTIAVEDDWVVRESGSYWFELRDEQGLSGGDEKKWEIRATQDQPPAVSLETPAGNLFVTPQSQPLIKAVAKDDLAVQRVELRYLRSDETQSGEQSVTLLEGPAEPSPRPSPEMAGDKQLVELRWDLTQLAGLEPGDWLDLHVAASDYRPQWGQSSTRRLTLISRDELDERLAQKQAQILAQLGDVLRLQTAARSQTRSLEIQLDEAGRFEKRDLDQLRGGELNQRQIQHALSDASDGVPARVRQLVEELESNRVDSPEVLRHMNELSAQIARLNRDTLPRIQQGLVETLKAARQRLEENPDETAPDRATAEPLRRAGQGQDQVIAALEEMLGELTQWDNYRRFAREVSRLQREQQEVRRDTDQLRLDTLTKELPDLTTQEVADLKRLAQRQVELARQLDKVQGRMQEMQTELRPADPLAAETLGDALDTARRLALSGQMRESGRSIESNRVGQAAQQQEQITEGLEELLDVLANRRVHELDRLLNQLHRSAEDLAQLRQDQAGVREQLAGAEQNPDAAARQMELQQGAAAEQQLAERTAELARRLERLQAPESGR